MAIIRVTGSFTCNDLFPEVGPTTTDFFNFGLSGVVIVSDATSMSFKTFTGGSTAQTDRVTGEFLGTNLTYTSPNTSGVTEISGTITSFSLSYLDLRFNGSSPGPVATQITEVTVSDIMLPAKDLSLGFFTSILMRVNLGDDQIFGSAFQDIIYGGPGNDVVYASNGNDQVFGDSGNDCVYGENGNDFLNGGSGDDLIDGGEGSDFILGLDGNDSLMGGAEGDTLEGGEGNDTLNSGGGNDSLFGGVGEDCITGGDGDDYIIGDTGAESALGENGTFARGPGDDVIYGCAGNDYIHGEWGNDVLFGDDGDDRIFGGGGNDWLVGGMGYDSLNGGGGDDGIVFDGNDNLAGYSGGEGYDTLFLDAAGSGNPFTVNLATQGFEQAIGTLVETGTEAWKSVTTIYNQAWSATSTEFLNDDGSKSIWRFDPGNQQSWREIRGYYAADGKLDYEQFYNDDGSFFFLDFDLANTQNWFMRGLLLDANGGFISETFTYDATIASRSTEIGAVAKKTLIDDALI